MIKSIELIINKQVYPVSVRMDETLLDILRHRLDLTGTKEACNQGECGACTVIIEGKAVMACLVLGVSLEGKQIETIEGLADTNKLHPLQESFIESGAVQCGFCTSGMIMSAKALLDKDVSAETAEIIQHLSGNHCRCTGYTKIIDAVLAAQNKMREMK